jgi:membrane-bound lytic murein transglycosylase D
MFYVPLIRPFYFSLILAIALVLPDFAQAEGILIASTSLTDQPAPAWLPSARNIRIELNPEPQPVFDNKVEFIPETDTVSETKAELPVKSASSPEIKVELVTTPVITDNDLWARIRNGFAMREFNSPLIAKHEQWYASRPDYVARITDRARRYLYFITSEVERRGMPSEIALLPMIESAFNPGALSTTRASGIWQFMPATGKNFGLQQNWWHDDRRDVIGATNGALDYLQKLHDMFDDWELALAAYNWGEGAVQRAQARNRRLGLPTDYSSLKMPAETRNYVPKLLAIKNIIADPARFGLTLQDIPDQPYFAAVATTKHMDVKLAAQLADISMEEFTALNPEHNRPVILQSKSDVILLPVDKTETFRANLESYDKPLVSWQSYQPKKGERLDQLAPRFGLTVANLKSVNGLSARGNISTGQTLLVPLNGEESDGEFEAFNMQLSPIDVRVSALKHTVRKGDTYASLARHYHVSIIKLKRLNRSTALRVGRPVTIALAATSRKHAGHRYVSRRHSSRSYASKNHLRKVTKVAARKRRIARG